MSLLSGLVYDPKSKLNKLGWQVFERRLLKHTLDIVGKGDCGRVSEEV